MSVDLAGEVVIITGAGAGLGRAHASEVARRGARVIVNDVDADAAVAVADVIRDMGGQAAAVAADITDPEQARELTRAAVRHFGTVHAVVNNAGSVSNGYFEELTPQQLKNMLAVHVEGSFYVTQPAWEVMRSNGYGRVIFTSSGAGAFGFQGMANYAAAKAGVLGLGRALAYEGRALGITVNSVLPVATTSILDADPVRDQAAHQDPHVPAGFDPALIAGRRDPAITSHLVAYLASRDCSVNGETFSVSLGRYSRVFTGATAGWLAADLTTLSAESIAANFDKVRALQDFEIYGSLHEETGYSMREIMRALGATPTNAG